MRLSVLLSLSLLVLCVWVLVSPIGLGLLTLVLNVAFIETGRRLALMAPHTCMEDGLNIFDP